MLEKSAKGVSHTQPLVKYAYEEVAQNKIKKILKYHALCKLGKLILAFYSIYVHK
jgi:hypothetical protein